MDIESIVENFEYLDDWEDRYKYLIELGNGLEEFPESERNGANKVNGCVSQVWITSKIEEGADPLVTFRGYSDAHIVRGLIAVTLAIFSNKKASEIASTNEIEYFNKIGLQEHITPQRSNGLISMVNRIKSISANVLQIS
ncbi:MAG: SufE family protein [Rhizobiaceae bacterium]|nr:SufE family protein [Rhizobiaceae bacterium]